jgi:two-component system chemotaxis response regulator CheY
MPLRPVILIVDDEDAMRHILKNIIAQVGDFEFFEAENGSTALKQMRQKRPDLVFLDLIMPVLSGVETLNTMKQDENLKDVYVIICTAEGSLKVVQKTFISGANDYIIKPFTMKIVQSKTKRWLEDFNKNIEGS